MYRSRLHIVHAVRSDGFSGVERHIALIASRLARRGHRLTVIGGDPARMLPMLEPVGAVHRAATTTWDVVRELSRAGRVDLVHAHMTAAELAAVATRPLLRAPIVSTRHFAARRGSSPAGRLAASVIGANLTAQISISRYVAERVDGASTVVHLGTQLPERVVPAGERSRVVLVAQRLEAEKRTDLALRVWAASGLATSGWRLQIAGAGAERTRLEALAHELGVADATEFLGLRTDAAELMSRAAVLLAPCPIEGFGLSAVEAMAAGTPVLASAAGAHAETVGSVEGAVLFPCDDIGAGGAALAALAGDVEQRSSYGAALRAAVETNFSDDIMVERILAVYGAALR